MGLAEADVRTQFFQACPLLLDIGLLRSQLFLQIFHIEAAIVYTLLGSGVALLEFKVAGIGILGIGQFYLERFQIGFCRVNRCLLSFNAALGLAQLCGFDGGFQHHQYLSFFYRLVLGKKNFFDKTRRFSIDADDFA